MKLKRMKMLASILAFGMCIVSADDGVIAFASNNQSEDIVVIDSLNNGSDSVTISHKAEKKFIYHITSEPLKLANGSGIQIGNINFWVEDEGNVALSNKSGGIEFKITSLNGFCLKNSSTPNDDKYNIGYRVEFDGDVWNNYSIKGKENNKITVNSYYQPYCTDGILNCADNFENSIKVKLVNNYGIDKSYLYSGTYSDILTFTMSMYNEERTE